MTLQERIKAAIVAELERQDIDHSGDADIQLYDIAKDRSTVGIEGCLDVDTLAAAVATAVEEGR